MFYIFCLVAKERLKNEFSNLGRQVTPGGFFTQRYHTLVHFALDEIKEKRLSFKMVFQVPFLKNEFLFVPFSFKKYISTRLIIIRQCVQF